MASALLGREHGDWRRCWMPSSARAPARRRSSRSAASPGMGKTRLVEDVVARSTDFRVVHSRCEEYEASTPYFAFRSIVRDGPGARRGRRFGRRASPASARRSERVDPSLEPVDPAARHPARPRPAGHARDGRPRRAVHPRSTGGGRHPVPGPVLSGAPSIFLIEDVHHLDEASHDLLLRTGASGRAIVARS